MVSHRGRKRAMAVAAVVLAAVGAGGYLAVREPSAPTSLPGFRAAPLPADRASRAGLDVATTHAGIDLASVGARWYLNWTDKPDPTLSGEFVPLVCGYPGAHRVRATTITTTRDYIVAHRDQYPDGTLWLVGNEIGNGDQKDRRSPADYAADFHACATMLKAINPTFTVSVGPAVLSTNPTATRNQVAGTGLSYLRDVLDAYRSAYHEVIPAEWFAATAYVVPNGGFAGLRLYRHAHHDLDLAVFADQIRNLRRLLADEGLRGRSVVITELGDPFAGGRPAKIARFMADASTYLATATDPQIGCTCDTDHLVQRWAWFLAQPLSTWTKLRHLHGGALIFDLAQTSLFDRSRHPTYLAHVYAQLTGAAPRTS